MYLSKSLARDLGCETFFARYHLDPTAIAVRSPLAETGTQFHLYKSDYIGHLIDAGLTHDPEWVKEWLRRNEVSTDAYQLIEQDIDYFTVTPENVIGAEVYLSVDENWQAVEQRLWSEPGAGPKDSRSRVGGTLDLMELSEDGKTLFVCDWKTVHSMASTTEGEAAIHALLGFAHFPSIETVQFSWWYARFHKRKDVIYTRQDLDWITSLVQACLFAMESVIERYNRGEKLEVAPFSGLCTFCALRCPMYAAFSGEMALPAIQTEDDAVRLAANLYVARMFAQKADAMLKAFLGQHGSLELGEYRAELQTQTVRKYPLKDTLAVLGITVPEKTPEWDNIPLNSLSVSNLNSFASAKKRAGLPEALRAKAKESTKTVLRIAKKDGTELIASGEDE